MTAIGGYWGQAGQSAAERCGRILKSQAIYGPHHEAQGGDGAVAIGRRLFRLLPEDAHDRGPVAGGDGKLLLAADVRLDNRDELTATLDLPTAGLSDAAVLMAALERWDEDALDRIVGDFAFALWDSRRERLLLARDFMGQRPLHYHRGDGFFAFASMPKGLHALPEIPYAPHERTAADFLALMPETGPESFFDGVERVLPGHSLSVDRNGVTARRYWRPARTPLRLQRPEDYAEALRTQMDAAVRSRLRGAGAAVAAHLSGGLDSATVATTAARLLAPEGGTVIGFTSVPSGDYPVARGRFGDEGPLAQATADLHSNIEHVRIRAGDRSFVEGMDRNFFLYDRPLINLCNMAWIDAICDETRDRGLKVLLTGQMGNMSFSYGGLELLPELLGKGRLVRLARLALALKREGLSWKNLASTIFGPYLPPALWTRLLTLTGRSPITLESYSAVRMSAIADFRVSERAIGRGLDLSYRPWKDGFTMRRWVLGRVDPGNYNKGMLGGWGVDCRDPTADRRLVEFCLAVPGEQFVLDGQARSLAKRAFADRLPAAVLEEKRKGYQSSDWPVGLAASRAGIAAEIERLAGCAPADMLLDLARLEKLVADWPADGWDRPETVESYRFALLRGISTGHFLRKASGSN